MCLSVPYKDAFIRFRIQPTQYGLILKLNPLYLQISYVEKKKKRHMLKFLVVINFHQRIHSGTHIEGTHHPGDPHPGDAQQK